MHEGCAAVPPGFFLFAWLDEAVSPPFEGCTQEPASGGGASGSTQPHMHDSWRRGSDENGRAHTLVFRPRRCFLKQSPRDKLRREVGRFGVAASCLARFERTPVERLLELLS